MFQHPVAPSPAQYHKPRRCQIISPFMFLIIAPGQEPWSKTLEEEDVFVIKMKLVIINTTAQDG